MTDPNAQQPATVDIVSHSWTLGLERWQTVPLYGKTRGAIEDAAYGYARTLGDEVEVLSQRAPARGRLYFWGGHVLGWGGALLALYGLLTQGRPDFDALVFGPFGIGLLAFIASGPLVRHGRRILTPDAREFRIADKRRPVLLLASFRNSDKEIVADAEAQGHAHANAVEDTLGLPFRRFGPFSALRTATASPDTQRPAGAFGDANWDSVAARQLDQAALLVAVPGAGPAFASEIDAIARRRHAHKLLVLMPPLNGVWPWDGTIEDANDEEHRRRRNEIDEALDWRPRSKAGDVWDRTKRRVRSLAETEEALRLARWANLREGLKAVPGFGELPETAPRRVIAVHLVQGGEPVIITGPKIPNGADYIRAIAFAVYGMKCHGRS